MTCGENGERKRKKKKVQEPYCILNGEKKINANRIMHFEFNKNGR